MFSGGLNKLDGWKDLKQVDSAAERRHKEVAEVHKDGETLQGRLDQALKKYNQPSAKESLQPKVSEKVAEGIGQRTLDNGQRTNGQVAGQHVKTTVVASPTTQPAQIYKTPASPPSHGKQPPHVAQASNFVQPMPNSKQPLLANLLRGSNTPPAPPKSEEKKQPTAKEGAEIKKEVLSSSAKVEGPAASDAGAKLANATKKRDEGDVGKKREDKKSEGGKKSEGKSALASSRADRSQGGESLGAAAGGLAGGSSEPLWIADLEPGVKTFNAHTISEKNYSYVSGESALYKRYILKNNDMKILENALTVHNDPELDYLLALGMRARKNPYGGLSG